MENQLITNTEKQEIVPITKKAVKRLELVKGLSIKTDEDFENASELFLEAKNYLKIIKDKEGGFTKHINALKAELVSFFGPAKNQWTEIHDVLKSKIEMYQTKKLEQAKKENDKVVAKVEAGKMDFDQAGEKFKEVAKTAKIEAGSVTFRTIKDVELEDESLLPREYLVPDMVKIRKVALAGVKIPGVKVVEKVSAGGKIN
jgi:hypothetical protein